MWSNLKKIQPKKKKKKFWKCLIETESFHYLVSDTKSQHIDITVNDHSSIQYTTLGTAGYAKPYGSIQYRTLGTDGMLSLMALYNIQH